MRYLADTIIDYIWGEIQGKSGTFRFILPAYSSKVLTRVGVELEEKISRVLEKKVDFEYGVAYKLGVNWNESETQEIMEDFNFIKNKGWYNLSNNLTSIRNKIKKPEVDCLLIVLAGYEHIDDKESLRDFFHLDQNTVWEICLDKTFYNWVQNALKNHLNLDDNKNEFKQIAELIKTIYDLGLADILTISDYLEKIDFTTAMSGNDAYQLVLENLQIFKLPRMTGLTSSKTKRSLAKYILTAQEFFNYSMFFKQNDRKKYLKKIENYSRNSSNEDLDADILGEFELQEDLLDTLKEYIENRTGQAFRRLKTADFIYVHDNILSFKERKLKPKTNKVKKLEGLAPEIFLHALWETLGEFKKEAKKRANFTYEQLLSITFQSESFRHDFDADTEDDEGQSDNEVAKTFLRQLLGGIDSFLEKHIQLQFDNDYDNTILLSSKICPSKNGEEIKYQKNSNAEPNFKFKVLIKAEDGGIFKKDFIWPLPQNHQSRLLITLYKWAREQYTNRGHALPVFTASYVKELFMAKDEEEATRLLNQSLRHRDSKVLDLFLATGIDDEDELKRLLINLSFAYQVFISKCLNEGFFNALQEEFHNLRMAYCDAFERYLENSMDSLLGPLLLKAFFIIPEKKGDHSEWLWDEYLQAAVVTPLHPAMLEMIYHQNIYLCDSLCENAKLALEGASNNLFVQKHWDRIVDLSRIQWPIYGILTGINKTLDTNIKGFGYIHLVGESDELFSAVASKILLEYHEIDEDDDIAEAELFRETRASMLIRNMLMDYRELYSFADDGISIGAYCGREVQPIISGIDNFLAHIIKERDDREYSLKLTIFSDSRDDYSIMRWINAWKDRWQVAELASGKRHYGDCCISIKYRVISRNDNFEQFESLINDSNFDIFLFTEFLRSKASHFQALDNEMTFPTDYRKFPISEKVCSRVVGGGKEKQRERILTNKRFILGALHGEVMASLKQFQTSAEKKHAIISINDYQPWSNIINSAHKNSGWVVCIDSSIDEQLLRNETTVGGFGREIIGFGTGVGPYGENNYTVSTEEFSMVEIESKIASHVQSLLGPLQNGNSKGIAYSLIREVNKVVGLSLVKATGPEKFVRELIANAMVRKILQKDTSIFCDEIISLDAFLHWFDEPFGYPRPDLLRIQAEIIDGHFHIKIQIIECKLARQLDGYLEKARQQIESGLKQLVPKFRPRRSFKPDDYRIDQRYWWMQLHRIISTKGKTTKAKYNKVLSALERLSEGFFSITWQAAAVAFWIDQDKDFLEYNTKWNYIFDNQELNISVVTTGRNFIKKTCLENVSGNIFNDASCLKYQLVQNMEVKKAEQNKPQNSETFYKKINEEGNKKIRKSTEQDISDKKEKEICTDEKTKAVTYTKKHIPKRILLGSGTAGGRDAYWEFGHPNLPNRHILVFGASGTGKTYCIQALMSELAKVGQNSLIVDYTSGFTNTQLEPIIKEKLKPKQYFVRKEPLEVNPFRKQCNFIDDIEIEEDSASIANRVSGVFNEVYKLGDQQKSALYNSIRDGINNDGSNFNLNGLIERLEVLREKGGPTAASAASVISKIQPFVDMKPFGKERPESWDHIFSDNNSKCHIIQLASFVKNAAQLITEFSLIDLYWYYRSKGSKDNPKIIVLDEIQNLDHRIESPLGQFLTEGRKFGISLILATQTLSNLEREQKDRLFQASHKLFFRPADTEIKSFAQILADSTGKKVDEWVEKLSTLKRGECYSIGYAYNEQTNKLEVNKHFRVKIKGLQDRF